MWLFNSLYYVDVFDLIVDRADSVCPVWTHHTEWNQFIYFDKILSIKSARADSIITLIKMTSPLLQSFSWIIRVGWDPSLLIVLWNANPGILPSPSRMALMTYYSPETQLIPSCSSYMALQRLFNPWNCLYMSVVHPDLIIRFINSSCSLIFINEKPFICSSLWVVELPVFEWSALPLSGDFVCLQCSDLC